jgi:hypothetical protein
MKTCTNKLFLVLAIAGLIAFGGCGDETPPLPDNLVQFEAAQLGFTEAETTINIRFSRAADAAVVLPVSFTLTGGLVYGTHFTTTPAAVGNTITVQVAAGAEAATFRLTKVAGALFDGDEKITFTLPGAPAGLVMGERTQLEVSFSEIIATQGTMEVNGGGAAFPNRVFIDLSANRQTAVNRQEWDLGFFQQGGEFRVILNNALNVMARPTTRSQMAEVTAADSAGLRATLHINAFLAANMAHVDDPAGDMNRLAIGTVSATEAENRVFILNRGTNVDNTPRSWKKVRVLRNGTGYTLQHADIGSATFQSVNIPRNPDFMFTYVRIDNNSVVTIEPEKDKWDIAYSTFMNQTLFRGQPVPYPFNDIIIQNRHGVQTAEVMTATGGSYEAFGEAGLANITFGASQVNIGSRWRIGGGPGGAVPSVRTDRFYVIRDESGNVYKLRFTSLTTNGERGRPQLEFALVRRG